MPHTDLLEGTTSLGIELGSTRIKAVLIDTTGNVLAQGSHTWENTYSDGIWTYSIDSVWEGLRGAVGELLKDVEANHGIPLRHVGAIGISAMMHGYIALDDAGELLTPFRTWRNTNTGPATRELTAAFGVNIPHRWSIAHHYQSILDGEAHVSHIAHLTTLAGYVHHRLSGEFVLGIGDASGMFPIAAGTYDEHLVETYNALTLSTTGHSIREILPRILSAGENGGRLSEAGALLLDPTATLGAGAVMCPPEGDAGTGMVATNAVSPRTGNVSAGTSIFAMIVLERPFAGIHEEIDLVTTPSGDQVAMVHCNNGASEFGAWARVFTQFAEAIGVSSTPNDVFAALLSSTSTAAPDAAGLTAFNYLAGEPITHTDAGRPMFLRTPDSTLDLPNFVRAQLYGIFTTLRIGMDVLTTQNVAVDVLHAHGGLFATPGIAQRALAAALDVPVSVGSTASAGGAWGMALLADFTRRAEHMPLATYLNEVIFAEDNAAALTAPTAEVQGYASYLDRFVEALPAQRAASAS